MKWGHDQLANDLAAHLRGTSDRVVWTDMQLGPHGSPRPDVYTIPKSFSRFVPVAYEVKISVADFRRDITAGKWQSYLKFAAGVIFAVPQGLITKADVPPGCGLIIRTEDGWKNIKGPTLARVPDLPRELWIKLIIDGIERAQSPIPEARAARPWVVQQAIRKKYGEELADALSSRDNAIFNLQQQRERWDGHLKLEQQRNDRERLERQERLKSERVQVDQYRAELCTALGLEHDATIWDIRHAAREAADAINRDKEIARLKGQIERMQDHLRRAADAVQAEVHALLANDNEAAGGAA